MLIIWLFRRTKTNNREWNILRIVLESNGDPIPHHYHITTIIAVMIGCKQSRDAMIIYILFINVTLSIVISPNKKTGLINLPVYIHQHQAMPPVCTLLVRFPYSLSSTQEGRGTWLSQLYDAFIHFGQLSFTATYHHSISDIVFPRVHWSLAR